MMPQADDKWIEEILKTRYPSGMQVYYSVEELQKAIEKGDVKKDAPVGLCYHAVSKAHQVGQSAYENAKRRMQYEVMLHENVVILVSKRAFFDHFRM
jgi:precorrin-4 methylase